MAVSAQEVVAFKLVEVAEVVEVIKVLEAKMKTKTGLGELGKM
jgi:hypothetical protein